MANDSTIRQRMFPLPSLANRPNYHWFVVGTVCIGAFMAALDGSIVTVALPPLTQDFHARISSAEWVALAYLLTLTALLTTCGRVADIIGRRPLYTLGFSVFIIGSALCGAAPSLSLLIAWRVLQAVGAVLLQANSVAIVTAAAPAHERGRAIGIQGSALAIGLSLGPAIGGLLVGAFGWRSVFYVNVPVGIIGTTLAFLLLPRDANKDAAARHHHFDYFGGIFIALCLIGLIFGLNQGNTLGWSSPEVLGSFAAGILFLAAFIWEERRHPAPLLDLSLFRIGPWTWGNVSGALSYALMYAALYAMPYFYEDVMHRPAAISGLLTMALPAGMMIMAPMAGRISDKVGPALPTRVGMAIATAGIAALILLGANPSYAFPIVALFVIGLGMGVFTPPNNSSVMGSSPPHRLGITSGVLNMSRSLGQSVGIAYVFAVLEGVLFAAGFHSLRQAPAGVLLTGFHAGFAAVALLGLAAIAITLWRGHEPHEGHDGSAAHHVPLE